MAPRGPKSSGGKVGSKADTSSAPAPPTRLTRSRKPAIYWEKNETWIQLVFQKLQEDPDFRHKLFSGDSTSEAKQEGRKKAQGKDGKTVMYGKLAESVFTSSFEVVTRPLKVKKDIPGLCQAAEVYRKWG
jgi:hypothetical protein